MCHFKQLPYLALAEINYWSSLSYTSYFVHEAQQDVLSYILIDGINIFLSPRCTSNRRMWTCLASVVKFDLSVISSEHWFGYDLWWTCSSNAAGDLSSLRYWFWKKGGGRFTGWGSSSPSSSLPTAPVALSYPQREVNTRSQRNLPRLSKRRKGEIKGERKKNEWMNVCVWER